MSVQPDARRSPCGAGAVHGVGIAGTVDLLAVSTLVDWFSVMHQVTLAMAPVLTGHGLLLLRAASTLDGHDAALAGAGAPARQRFAFR